MIKKIKVGNLNEFDMSAVRKILVIKELMTVALLDVGNEIVKHAKANHGGQDSTRYKDQTGALTKSIGIGKVEIQKNKIVLNLKVVQSYAAIVEERKPYLKPAAQANEKYLIERGRKALDIGAKYN